MNAHEAEAPNRFQSNPAAVNPRKCVAPCRLSATAATKHAA